jgi:hypothetical protein
MEDKYKDLHISGVGYKEVVSKLLDPTADRNFFLNIGWQSDGFGYGNLGLTFNKEGILEIDSECMSNDFIKAVLCKLVDEAKKVK